jgi:N-methylhydantoinase A
MWDDAATDRLDLWSAEVLVTTDTFRDILEPGRFRVPRHYDLDSRKPDSLVERRLRFKVPQ